MIGGQSKLGVESTIVRVIENIPHILRPGSITPEQIENIVGNCILDNKNIPSVNLEHYQLSANSILVYSSDNTKMVNKINELSYNYQNSAIVCCIENKNLYTSKNVITVGSKDNLNAYSKNLFSSLQMASSLYPDIILIEGIEQKGLGIAIMNRLLNCCNNNFYTLD